MELSHSFTVPARVDVAWATFMDLERVGGCFPGATVTGVSDDGFSGTVKVKLGPVALQYAGSGTFAERDDGAHRAVIEAKGKDKRGNGTAGATVTVQLTAEGESTRAEVTTDLAITGKPAQFGRGVMQDVSDKLLQQFVACIESQFDTATTGSDPSADATPPTGDGAERAAPTAGAPVSSVVTPGTATAAATSAPGPAGSTAAGAPPVLRDADPAATVRRTPDNPTRPVSSAGGSSDDALDLGATVLPVLARQYAPYLVSAAVGLVLGILIGRRRRH